MPKRFAARVSLQADRRAALTLTDIGDDVEVCIARLLQAAGFDTELAGVGIVYLDEVDKLAKSDSGSSGEGRTKDVGGLGVQQVRLGPVLFVDFLTADSDSPGPSAPA